jgi:hypothetical protein
MPFSIFQSTSLTGWEKAQPPMDTIVLFALIPVHLRLKRVFRVREQAKLPNICSARQAWAILNLSPLDS